MEGIATKKSGGVFAHGIQIGSHEQVDDVDTIVTGLKKLAIVVLTMASDPELSGDQMTATIGDQAGAPAAGSFYLKSWRRVAADDANPALATSFGQITNWLAIEE